MFILVRKTLNSSYQHIHTDNLKAYAVLNDALEALGDIEQQFKELNRKPIVERNGNRVNVEFNDGLKKQYVFWLDEIEVIYEQNTL